MTRAPLRIVTRGSALALWQAHHVRAALEGPDGAPELVVVRTTGDRVQDVALSRIGDRGLFTREVDDALLDGRADLAVHSAKDVPTVLPDGLEIVAFMTREDPSDVLVVRPGLEATLDGLPRGARVGTSSLRRRAQLAALRPDLEVVDLRGNVDTRITRVREGMVDAALLARAGIARLGRLDDAGEALAPPAWLPAVGQGALALVMRSADPRRADVARLDDAATRPAVVAERAFLRTLEGGCQVPIGAFAGTSGDALELHGGVFSLDGSTSLRDSLRGDATRSAELGVELAERLVAAGADRILADVRARAAVPEVAGP
ncbi:MAG TPA: hydroxymethylbilane synthase [Longimicrobiales bacterium]